MADIPNQAISRCIKHIMQRDSQLNYTQAGPKMPASLGNSLDHIITQLFCQHRQLAGRQGAQLIWCGDLIQ